VGDEDILGRISQLADEERALEGSHIGEGLSDGELERLRSIEVSLDQCWDLLRQRDARRHAGRDPESARVRPASVVEGYKQ